MVASAPVAVDGFGGEAPLFEVSVGDALAARKSNTFQDRTASVGRDMSGTEQRHDHPGNDEPRSIASRYFFDAHPAQEIVRSRIQSKGRHFTIDERRAQCRGSDAVDRDATRMFIRSRSPPEINSGTSAHKTQRSRPLSSS